MASLTLVSVLGDLRTTRERCVSDQFENLTVLSSADRLRFYFYFGEPDRSGVRAGERDDKSLLAAAAFVAANDLAREFGWTTPLNREGRDRGKKGGCERAQDRAGQLDVTVQRSSVVRLAQPAFAFAVARFFPAI